MPEHTNTGAESSTPISYRQHFRLSVSTLDAVHKISHGKKIYIISTNMWVVVLVEYNCV